MATPGLAGQRHGGRTYGSKTRTHATAADPDHFGERVPPSSTHTSSRTQPTKSTWDPLKPKPSTVSKMRGAAGMGEAPRPGKKRDVFDLPSDSDDAITVKTKRLATSKRKEAQTLAHKPLASSKSAAHDDRGPAKKNIPAATQRNTTQVDNKAQGRALSHPKTTHPSTFTAKRKENSNIFDISDSDDEPVISKKSNRQTSAIKKGATAAGPKTRSAAVQPTRQALTSPGRSQNASNGERFQGTTIYNKSTSKQKPTVSDSVSLQQEEKEVSTARAPVRSPKPSSLALPHRAVRSRVIRSPNKEPPKVVVRTRRTVTTATKRKAVLSETSAPAMFSSMVAESTSTSESPPSHPLSPSPVPSMQFDSLRTPSPRRSPSLGLTTQAMIETPRQNALWGKLLDTIGDTESHADIPLSTLRISTARKRPHVEPSEASSNLNGMKPRKKVKLIETLKKSSFTDDEASDDESDVSDHRSFVKPKMSIPEPQTTTPMTFQSNSKTTYGQHRSRLADQNEEEEMMDMLIEDFSQPLLGSLKDTKKDSYDLQSDSSDEDEGGQPKSAHDLRAAGSKKRMLQDLESLVSGVEGEGFSSMSSKRSDLLELTKKCFEQGVVDLILDHELDRQLLATFSKSTDAVFDFLAASCLGFLVKDTKQITVIRGITRSGFTPRLIEMLDIEQDIGNVVKERRFNMSGIAQRKIRAFREPLLQSDLWSDLHPTMISPQIAALRTLELLIRRSRELGAEDGPLDESGLLRILRILEDHTQSAPTDIQLQLILSILESSSIGYSTSGRSPWSSKAFKTITHHLPSVLSNSSSRAIHMRNLTLRLVLNLTNNNAKACNNLATPGLISSLLDLIIQGFKNISNHSEGEEEEPATDELILSLGAMINLAELSNTARQNVTSSSTSPLASLAHIFSTRPDATAAAASLETTRSNVTYGYLGLLLINLCQTELVRQQLLQLLPGGALAGLVAAAEEFIAIHQQTDREMFAARSAAVEGEANVHTEYTRRLMGMVQRLKEAAAVERGV